MIPALLGGRGRWQVNLCEFKANLIYRLNSRLARTTERNPVLKDIHMTYI